MSNAQLFSVIIPTLNEEEYLPALLGDLTQQTFKDFEVVIADGGSTDSTIEKINQLAQNLPLQTFKTKKNVSLQRNFGANKAKGHYLVFFDADVRIPHNFLKTLASQIRKHPGYLYTTSLAANQESQTQLVLIEFTNFTLELFNSLGKPFAPGCNIIVETGLFKKLGGFDPSLKLAEDHDLVQRSRKLGVILKILKRPILYPSFRRPEKIGYLKLITQYAVASLYTLFGEPIRKELFDYPMGGDLYKNTGVGNSSLIKKIKALKKQILDASHKIELPF